MNWKRDLDKHNPIGIYETAIETRMQNLDSPKASYKASKSIVWQKLFANVGE